jgi:tetratricopeptide (TPR) repeat protein
VSGALESHRKALAISEAMLAADPNNEANKSDVAFTEQRLGEADAANHDLKSALENYRKALAIREATLTADSSNARARDDVSSIYADIGNVLSALSDHAGAVAAFVKAVPLAEEVSAQSPTNMRLRARLALRYLEAGKSCEQNARPGAADAQTHYRQAKDYLGKSLSIWQDLRSRGTLSPTDSNKPEEVIKEIAKCDAALAKIS